MLVQMSEDGGHGHLYPAHGNHSHHPGHPDWPGPPGMDDGVFVATPPEQHLLRGAGKPFMAALHEEHSQLPERSINGEYFSFKTGGNPADVVDRFYAKRSGDTVTYYRNQAFPGMAAKPGKIACEKYTISGDELAGPVKATIQRNGDIVYSHGYTSRKVVEAGSRSQKAMDKLTAVKAMLAEAMENKEAPRHLIKKKVAFLFGNHTDSEGVKEHEKPRKPEYEKPHKPCMFKEAAKKFKEWWSKTHPQETAILE